MKNVVIKNETTILPGSVKWLKGQISKMEFKFGMSPDGYPCVYYCIPDKDVAGIVKRTWYRAVVFTGTDVRYDDSYDMVMREYKTGCYIIYTCYQAMRHSGCWFIFSYLTVAARVHLACLLDQLADKLIEKLENDGGKLDVTITVA